MIIDKTKFDILRAEQCLKIKDILEKANCSRTTICKINSGSAMDPCTAGRIARALNVAVTDIIVEEGG